MGARNRIAGILLFTACFIALPVVLAGAENTQWGTDTVLAALAVFFVGLLLLRRRDRTSIILLLAVPLYALYFIAASYWGVPRWLNLAVAILLGGGYLVWWLVIPFIRGVTSGLRGPQH